MFEEFEKLLEAHDEFEMREREVGPDKNMNGYYFKDIISIHVSPLGISFYKKDTYKDIKDVPPEFDTVGVEEDGTYFTVMSVPLDIIMDLVPLDVMDYIIYNMEKF